MAHAEELLAAALAVWGTRELRGKGTVPWAALEEGFETDLTGRTTRPSKTRVYGDGEPVTPEAWLAGLPKEGVKRLALAPVGDGERMLHAFAGTGGVVLVAVGSQVSVGLRTRTGRTPATLLTSKDVLAFLEQQPDPAGIREALLWQDEHNLHVTDGRDWPKFVAALEPEHDVRLIQAMDMTLSNVRFQRGEGKAWWALKRAHKNPDEAWQYAFVDVGPTDGALGAGDVADQAVSLDLALENAASFARRAPVESYAQGWADVFDQARALLGTAPVPERYTQLFGGSGMTPATVRLLATTCAADVFGGMGSWNDLGYFHDDAEYGRLSQALYECLQPCLCAAVNATTAG